MQIRTKLALRFSLIVASILLLFSLAVYYFSATYRQQEFTSRLKEKALNTAKAINIESGIAVPTNNAFLSPIEKLNTHITKRIPIRIWFANSFT